MPEADPLDFHGRTVLVTGASSGIGRATAARIAGLGGRVVLVARNPERLCETLRALPGEGHAVEPFDVGDAKAIPEWLKGVAARRGSLDGVVHSAGAHLFSPLRVLPFDKVEALFRVNTLAGLGLIRGFRQKSVCAGNKSIVLLASVVALVGEVGVSAYSASKGAVTALTRSAALELAPEGIRVNCVAPGYVRSEMTDRMAQSLGAGQTAQIAALHPLGIGEPEDVAHAVVFLLSGAARWITGTTLVVDGGYTAR